MPDDPHIQEPFIIWLGGARQAVVSLYARLKHIRTAEAALRAQYEEIRRTEALFRELLDKRAARATAGTDEP